MKADLITLQAVNNYGSVLQAYATQEFFKEFGVNINIINFIREDRLPKNVLKAQSKNLLERIILFPSLKKQDKVFGLFRNKYLNLTSKKYTYDDDFDNYKSEADFFITGSDQVWNSTHNQGIVNPLYLSFVKDKPKIAFAASFGKTSLNEDEVVKTRKMINDYIKISVREESAVEILKKQYKYDNVTQVLDPTLFLDKKFWNDFGSKGKKYENYILIYQLKRNSEFDEYAKKLAKKMNCKLIRIRRAYHQFLYCGNGVLLPDVETFVSLFANARLVVTDSFHALSFCTNLNVSFVCFYPDRFSTRLESHLKLFELEDRRVTDISDLSIIDIKIDWESVNEILYREREKSKNFVKECLDIIKSR